MPASPSTALDSSYPAPRILLALASEKESSAGPHARDNSSSPYSRTAVQLASQSFVLNWY